MRKVQLYGTLIKDLEVRYTRSAMPTAITNTSIAVADGRNKDKTHFFDIKAIGKTGENMAKFFKKGDPILVNGRLEHETWSKDGQNYSRVTVLVEEFYFTRGSKREDNTQGANAGNVVADTTEDEFESVLPF